MCGIIGVVTPLIKNCDTHTTAANEVYKGLLTLQHRGQDAAGILSFDDVSDRLLVHKSEGLVTNVFSKENLANLVGNISIGHCRYPTIEINGQYDLQPLSTARPFGIAMAHNGNIINYHQLQRFLKEELKTKVMSNNDLEVILQLWSYYLCEYNLSNEFSFQAGVEATAKIMKMLVGGYSVVGVIAGHGLFAFRDPHGIRPLVIGSKLENGVKSYVIASETHPLNYLGYQYERDVAPGEFIYINKNLDKDDQIQSKIVSSPSKKATCMFEYVYFASAESAIEKKSVYRSRLNLGEALAQKVKTKILNKTLSPDIVCPVPDTSRTAAIALAESLRIPYREGLIKNRYIQRSFILDNQEEREKAVELKLSPVISEVKDKNILLVDDSVVRGTTSKKIISLLKKYGAKDVTLAVTCPPIAHACFYGIDYPDESKLAANNKSCQEVAEWIGAKEVIFLEEADLTRSIGDEGLCMACVNNKYPTDISDAVEFKNKR